MRIKKGDTVLVISGRSKGIRGEVIRVLPRDERLVVQGANLRKKHQKQVQAGGRSMNPGIIQYEAPMHASHVMLVCPKCDKPTRVGVKREEGKARRICKQCEAVLE